MPTEEVKTPRNYKWRQSPRLPLFRHYGTSWSRAGSRVQKWVDARKECAFEWLTSFYCIENIFVNFDPVPQRIGAGVVNGADLKSAGLWPQRFESSPIRIYLLVFIFLLFNWFSGHPRDTCLSTIRLAKTGTPMKKSCISKYASAKRAWRDGSNGIWVT